MYKALIAYDGTRYFGWQKTVSGPSIQQELETAIWQITGERTIPEAASRTDRGVHAAGQVVQFALFKPIDSERLLRGLNAVLPSDIRVLELAPQSFHPTLDATGKEYRYRLCQGPVQDPTMRLYSWHFRHPLNEAEIDRAAQRLTGKRDFTALANGEEKNPICTLESIVFLNGVFQIRGDRFLYKMVRNLVGMLVYVGCGKLAEDSIPSILKSRDRKMGAVTAPAHGLCLHQVFYTENDSKTRLEADS